MNRPVEGSSPPTPRQHAAACAAGARATFLEFSHPQNRDILFSSVAGTIGAVITWVVQFAFFFGGSDDDDGGGNPIAALLMLLLAPIATIIQLAISRSREFGGRLDRRPDYRRPAGAGGRATQDRGLLAWHPTGDHQPLDRAPVHLQPLHGWGRDGQVVLDPPEHRRAGRAPGAPGLQHPTGFIVGAFSVATVGLAAYGLAPGGAPWPGPARRMSA